MNATVTVQVENLPAVQQALAEANAEIERTVWVGGRRYVWPGDWVLTPKGLSAL